MFAKNTPNQSMNGTQNAESNSINMISEGSLIKGTIAAANDIRIAGTIDGQAESKGRLVLTSKGRIKGNLVAHDGDIAGSVEGEVHISGTLILRKSAKVRGDIHTKSIIIEEGATFNGACKMSANPLEGVESMKKIKAQAETQVQSQTA